MTKEEIRQQAVRNLMGAEKYDALQTKIAQYEERQPIYDSYDKQIQLRNNALTAARKESAWNNDMGSFSNGYNPHKEATGKAMNAMAKQEKDRNQAIQNLQNKYKVK